MKVPHFYVRYYCEKEKNVKYCAGQLKYLIAIKELKEKGGRIRCVSISEHLGVSRPSVSKMLRCLVESGLVREDFCTSVELTEKGEEVINEIYSGYAESIHYTRFYVLYFDFRSASGVLYSSL